MISDGWATSSFCGGAENCVEVRWTTSTFCSGGDCVEVGLRPGVVAVRDTKDRTRAVHAHSPAAWSAFLAGIRAREFGGTG
jgi:hypothetical protein